MEQFAGQKEPTLEFLATYSKDEDEALSPEYSPTICAIAIAEQGVSGTEEYSYTAEHVSPV
jgi:hypothetical protein